MKFNLRNYNFDFSKNERKILTTFVKQLLKQVTGNQKLFAEEKAFNSILDKLNSGEETVKLTKDEFTRLRYNMEFNLKFLREQSTKGWFWKKWLYKSMITQYSLIYDTHFKNQ